MSFPPIMDQYILQEAPLTRHTKSSVMDQRNRKSEITKLEAQCEQFNLELVKVRLWADNSKIKCLMSCSLFKVFYLNSN